jgi:hypothetical protein
LRVAEGIKLQTESGGERRNSTSPHLRSSGRCLGCRGPLGLHHIISAECRGANPICMVSCRRAVLDGQGGSVSDARNADSRRDSTGWGDSKIDGHGMQEFPPNGDHDVINMANAPCASHPSTTSRLGSAWPV